MTKSLVGHENSLSSRDNDVERVMGGEFTVRKLRDPAGQDIYIRSLPSHILRNRSYYKLDEISVNTIDHAGAS